jgi:hypothetical protein
VLADVLRQLREQAEHAEAAADSWLLGAVRQRATTIPRRGRNRAAVGAPNSERDSVFDFTDEFMGSKRPYLSCRFMDGARPAERQRKSSY